MKDLKHVTSTTITGAWYGLTSHLTECAKKGLPPDGTQLREVLYEAAESGWREGYQSGASTGSTDAYVSRSFDVDIRKASDEHAADQPTGAADG